MKIIATKLKNLKITSVDLVTQGANQDACIKLYKSKKPENKKKFFAGIGKKLFKIRADKDNVGKNNIEKEDNGRITNEIWDYSCAFSESLSSIVCDNRLGSVQKRNMLLQSLDEFTEIIKISSEKWMAAETIHNNENDNIGEETETMKIDKSKMNDEELAQLTDFENKYGMAGNTGQETQTELNTDTKTGDANVNKSLPDALHPEVSKVLSEIAELKKALEMEKLNITAKKYEVIGKKASELAPKLYEMKKAGGTAYDDYVSLLDEQVSLIEKSGIFTETGKNTAGGGNIQSKIEKAALELQKTEPSLTKEAAFVKACEQNPELLAEYEKEFSYS